MALSGKFMISQHKVVARLCVTAILEATWGNLPNGSHYGKGQNKSSFYFQITVCWFYRCPEQPHLSRKVMVDASLVYSKGAVIGAVWTKKNPVYRMYLTVHFFIVCGYKISPAINFVSLYHRLTKLGKNK